jgi:hypothetical protein
VPARVVEWARAGGTLLLDSQATIADIPTLAPLWRDDTGATLAEGAAYGTGRLVRFTKSLAPADMPPLLDGDFPRRLRALLDSAPPAPARVAAVDHAPVTGGAAYPPAPRELAPWWILAIALVFALERWMATSRRRGVAA